MEDNKKILIFNGRTLLDFNIVIFFMFSLIIIYFGNNIVLSKMMSLMFFFIPGYLILRLLKIDMIIEILKIEYILLSLVISTSLIFIVMKLYIYSNINSLNVISIMCIIVMISYICLLSRNWKKIKKVNIKEYLILQYNIMSNNKMFVISCVLIIIFFVINVLFTKKDYIRFYDEYTYLLLARNIAEKKTFSFSSSILNIDENKITLFNMWKTKHSIGNPDLFFLISSFYFLITGFDSLSILILNLFWYTLLIPVFYFFGKLWSEKISVISSLLIASNPITFWYRYTFLYEIPLTIFFSIFLYYFIYSVDLKGKIKKYYYLLSIYLLIISMSFKISAIFGGVILYLLLLYQYYKQFIKGIFWKIQIIFITAVIVIFAFDLLKHMTLNYKFDVITYYLLSLIGMWKNTDYWLNAYTGYLCPFYYGMQIAVLIPLGVLLEYKKNKKNLLIFLSIISLFLWTSTSFNWFNSIRHLFPIFPYFFTFASISILNIIECTSMFCLPLTVILLFTKFVDPKYLHIKNNIILYNKIFLVIFIMILIISYLVKFFNVSLKINLHKKNLKIENKVIIKFFTFINILLIIVNSIITGFSFGYQRHPDLQARALKVVGEWVDNNTISNDIVMTTAPRHLSLYTEKCSLLVPPSDKNAFLQIIETGNVNFLIVFSIWPLSRFSHYPYLSSSLNTLPLNMTQIKIIYFEGKKICTIYTF